MNNVYLDSNIIYPDPFFKSLYGQLTLELSRRGNINLYMSRVVYEESKNNYKKQVEEMLEVGTKLKRQLGKFGLQEVHEYIEVKEDDVTHFLQEFEGFYEELFDEETINLIDYDSVTLSELIERSIGRIKPFSDKKEEFRDAIIWLSYVNHVETEDLNNCYLVCKNPKDFGEDNELYDQLKEDSDKFNLVYSLRELFEKSEEINRLKEPLEWEFSTTEQQETFVSTMLNERCFDTIFDAMSSYVNSEDPYSVQIDFDLYDLGHLHAYSMEILRTSVEEVEVLLDHVLIRGYVESEVNLEVSQYNPMREPGDDEFIDVGSESVRLNAAYSLSLNTDMEFDDLEVNDIEQK